MSTVEGAQFAGTKARVVQQRDDRLVTVLEIGRDGVTQTAVAEFLDLVRLLTDGR